MEWDGCSKLVAPCVFLLILPYNSWHISSPLLLTSPATPPLLIFLKWRTDDRNLEISNPGPSSRQWMLHYTTQKELSSLFSVFCTVTWRWRCIPLHTRINTTQIETILHHPSSIHAMPPWLRHKSGCGRVAVWRDNHNIRTSTKTKRQENYSLDLHNTLSLNVDIASNLYSTHIIL